MTQRSQGDGAGCAALFAALLVFGAIVAAAISLAALVDPFSWMPSLAEVWADCDDDYATSEDECSLATRYDGFWLHVAVNVVYALIAGFVLYAFAIAVADLRKMRRARFSGEEAAERYGEALNQCVGGATLMAILAAIPIIVGAL